MENTFENKAKYFALYWGQNVVFNRIKGTGFHPVLGFPVEHNSVMNNCYLDLKKLTEIEDKDSIAIGRMFLKGEQPTSELLYCGRIFATAMFDNDNAHETQLYNEHSQAIDYLRLNGYAVPFNGLSIKTLQDYGWLKI